MILCFAMQYSFTTKMVLYKCNCIMMIYGIDCTESSVWCCLRGLDS